jgi:hypothetical protein
MTDRLSLTNALADANIERQKAESIATEIFDAIHPSRRSAICPTAKRLSRALFPR